jgi:hypothetical protein
VPLTSFNTLEKKLLRGPEVGAVILAH